MPFLSKFGLQAKSQRMTIFKAGERNGRKKRIEPNVKSDEDLTYSSDCKSNC